MKKYLHNKKTGNRIGIKNKEFSLEKKEIQILEKNMDWVVKIFLILFFPILSCFSQASDFTYESLPVQENGRVKPLITLARESLTTHSRSIPV